MRKNEIIWWLFALAILIHFLLNMHSPLWFFVGSAIIGAIRVKRAGFFHFALLHIVALTICLLLKPADSLTTQQLGKIVPIGATGFIAAVGFITVLTGTLCSFAIRSIFSAFRAKV